MIHSLREKIKVVLKELEKSTQLEVKGELEIDAIEREWVDRTNNLIENHCSKLERVKCDLDYTSKALAILEKKWQKV